MPVSLFCGLQQPSRMRKAALLLTQSRPCAPSPPLTHRLCQVDMDNLTAMQCCSSREHDVQAWCGLHTVRHEPHCITMRNIIWT